MSLEETIEKLVDAKIEKAMQGGSQTVLAEYKGMDGQGKGWVIIAGSTEATPITRATVEASPGDTVSVTVGDGQCIMDANISNPSAGVVGVKHVAKTATEAKDDAEKAIAYSTQAATAASAAQTSADSAALGAQYAHDAADQAKATADKVQATAESAIASADAASTAAASAQESATLASDTASQAQASADSAQESADVALQSAHSAVFGLSEVEKVVGAAEWIYAHGTYSNDLEEFDANAVYWAVSPTSPTGYAIVDNPTEQGMWSYALTTDSTIDPDKTYYTQSTVYTYDLTHDTEIVEGKAYYVQVEEYTYTLTQDVEIVEGKEYYEWDSELEEYVYVEHPVAEDIGSYYERTSETVYELVEEPVAADLPFYYERTDTVTYELVENPDVSEISTYYERTSLYYVLDVSESVQNYIATHLALADDGLHIYGEADDYSALLGVDGLDIRKPGGTSVAQYGENFRVGATSGVFLQGTPTRLAFTSSAGDIVYFGLDDQDVWSMFMEQAYVRDMIRFGNYAWVKRANGNLTMKYLED